MSDAAPKPDFLVPSVLGLCLVAFILWVAFGGAIRETSWKAMRAQAVVMQHVIPLYPSSYQNDFRRFVQILQRPVRADLPASTLYEAIGISGKFLALPASLLMLALAVWIWRRSPAVRYRRNLDFEGLLQHNARVFPRIRPVMWLRGKTTKASRGNYTWPLAPYEWAALVNALRPQRRPDATKQSWAPAAARAAFAAQLGRPSSEPRAFHEDILLAAFAARLLGDKTTTERLLDAASAGFGPQWSMATRLWRQLRGTSWDWPARGPWEIRLDRQAEDRVAKTLARLDKGIAEMQSPSRHPDDPISKEGSVAAIYLRSQHIRCSLSRMLAAAQDTGIISTSDFIWLKAVDRCLFYALNDVGRRVASAESSGIRAHMQAEDAAGRAIAEPVTEPAVRALELHLTETAWSPPPAMDHESYLRSFTLDAGQLEGALEKPPMPTPPAGLFDDASPAA